MFLPCKEDAALKTALIISSTVRPIGFINLNFFHVIPTGSLKSSHQGASLFRAGRYHSYLSPKSSSNTHYTISHRQPQGIGRISQPQRSFFFLWPRRFMPYCCERSIARQPYRREVPVLPVLTGSESGDSGTRRKRAPVAEILTTGALPIPQTQSVRMARTASRVVVAGNSS